MELRSWRTWLRPGMLIKRWMILAMVGIIVISLGLAMGLTWAYRNYYWQLESTSEFVQLITLQFIPHPYREIRADRSRHRHALRWALEARARGHRSDPRADFRATADLSDRREPPIWTEHA